jgi:hypothetical protein
MGKEFRIEFSTGGRKKPYENDRRYDDRGKFKIILYYDNLI